MSMKYGIKNGKPWKLILIQYPYIHTWGGTWNSAYIMGMNLTAEYDTSRNQQKTFAFSYLGKRTSNLCHLKDFKVETPYQTHIRTFVYVCL